MHNLTLLDAISVTGSEVSMAKLPRRKCKVCREVFSPAYSNVVWCCPEHGAIYALELRAGRIRDKHRAEKPNAGRTVACLESVRQCCIHSAGRCSANICAEGGGIRGWSLKSSRSLRSGITKRLPVGEAVIVPQFKDRHCAITGIFVPVNRGGLFF